MARRKSTYELRKKADDPSYKRKETNLPAKKYKKTNPTQLRLSFELQGPDTQYIDIALALSAINRKLYRQGVYYYVNSVEVYNNSDEVVDLHVLPDTWVTRNAHVRAKAVFDKMNDLVLNNQRTIAPKYHDFKVYMSPLHKVRGSLNPVTYDVNAVHPSGTKVHAPDDWEYSKMVSADDDQDTTANADEFTLHMLGDHDGTSDNWDSVGVIRSYAETRVRVTGTLIEEANIRADPITNLLDFSSEEQINDIVDNLAADNNNTPYDADTYVGETSADMVQVARLVTTSTIGRAATAPGFCAPLGLIAIDSQVGENDKFRVVLNIAPGTYNGVYAERV